MNEALDAIVHHHPGPWRHIPTGEIHDVVWVTTVEVITVAENCAWLGPANQFISEFEAV